MVSTLWNLAFKSMAIEMGSRLTNALGMTDNFEFESYEDFKRGYENFMNAGFDHVEFFNTEKVMLRPEIEQHVNKINNIFMDYIEKLNMHTKKEEFD